MPVERHTENESRPRVYILRKANEKNIFEITKEIREVQKQSVDESTELLGKNTRLEKFILNSPMFVKKIAILCFRYSAKLNKKHAGTTAVTAIGMIGKFPGWVVPLGGTSSTIFVVGGISKKPAVVNDKIQTCDILHLTLTTDHDIVDGGPLVRYVQRLTNLLEDGFGLEKI